MACTALSPAAAVAGDLPSGGRVAHGKVDISSSAKTMNISQSSSRAVVNWRDFSIGRNARVDIRQPSSRAAILNRVDGSATSEIHGALTANGRVFLVNPNGVVVGPGGRVQAGGGFVASSLAMGDEDFMSGNLRFEGNGRSARVSNEGSIEVGSGGYAALLGGRVNNTGTIRVPLGRVGLGAGERIALDLSGDRFLQVALPSEDGGGDEALIEQAGTISADGGLVEISAATARHAARHAINLTGVVEARSVSGRSGAIVLGGGPGGRVTVSGRASTRPTAAPERSLSPRPRPGGSITVTGAEIALTGATIDASGDVGGSVRIGGDWRGSGVLPWSDGTFANSGTIIRADALDAGDGGSVVLWSGGSTAFEGVITARGGPAGGGGGIVEVSGHHLTFAGSVDLSAPAGATGTLVLDPINVLISNDPTENNSSSGDPDTIDRFAVGTPSIINAGQLSRQLSSANVVVSTTDISDPDAPAVGEPGNITVAAPLSWGSDNALTLSADNNILLQAGITAASGGLVLEAGNQTTTTSGADILVADFENRSGVWVQNLSTLPSFEWTSSFVPGEQFLRVVGGTGTEANPYLLADTVGYIGLWASRGLYGSNFALARDIDTEDQFGPGRLSIAPIGTTREPFTGSFDGRGFSLSNITVNGTTTAGIFGSTLGARIADLDLVDVDVNGTRFVGGLVGDAVDTIVDRVRIDATSTVTGTVGRTDLAVGGLIGRLSAVEGKAALTNAVSSASVVEQGVATGDSVLSTDVGNLVGVNDGVISSALAEGAVTASATEGAGRLFRRIGGAVGRNDGSMSQVYARGPVTVNGDGISISVAGLSGVVFGGSVFESFASGRISAPDDARVGGLIAADDLEFGATGENSFWDIDSTGTPDSEGGRGLTTSTMTSLTDFMAEAGPAWSFTEDWAPPDGTQRARLYALEPIVWAAPSDVSEVYGDTASLTLTGDVFGGPASYLFDEPGDALPDPIFDSVGLPTGDVGIYEITVPDPILSAFDVEYDVVLSPAALQITPRPLTVTALDVGKTYGTKYFFTDADFTAPNLATGDVLTSAILSSEGSAADAPVAGSPYVIAIDTSDPVFDNYQLTPVTGQMNVDPAPLTVTADDQSVPYGPAFTFDGTEFSVSGTLYNDDSVDLADITSDGAAATATVAGSPYDILIDNASGSGVENYDIIYVPGTFVRTRAPLTVTADDQSVPYGPAFTFAGTEFSVSGTLYNDDSVDLADITSDGAAGTATVAGSPYDILIDNASGSGVENYAIDYVPGAFVRTRAPLTVTADDQSVPYGPAFTFAGTEFSVSGTLYNDDSVDLADIASDGAAARAVVPGSPYPIRIDDATGSGLENYNIGYEEGDFFRTPAALTIIGASKRKTYGELATFSDDDYSTPGLIEGDALDVELSSLGAPRRASVGGSPYDIDIAVGPDPYIFDNYDVTSPSRATVGGSCQARHHRPRPDEARGDNFHVRRRRVLPVRAGRGRYRR